MSAAELTHPAGSIFATVAALQQLAALYEATGRQPRAAELRRRIPDSVTTFLTLRTVDGAR